MSKVSLEDIVSLCKRRGVIYQRSEIYGGLAGTWDYGPLGAQLKRNIVNEWLKFFVDGWNDMYLIDTTIIMNPRVWEASGHLDTFHDPLVECNNCHMRFREDKVDKNKCPNCGKAKTFGKPRDFNFRVREFEIMEFEYFIDPKDWEKSFDKWHKDMHSWFAKLGLDNTKVKQVEVPAEDRAHYSKRTIDFYYDFPSLGFDEIAGLAYRTDFDLKNHQEKSGKNLEYRPKDGSEPFIPHVIEPTFGLDRHVLAVLANGYSEDEQGGEKRVFLKLPAHLAPVKVAVFPLLKNKPELVKKAREVYEKLKKEVQGTVMWDDNGNIGKRYRRQDEIGTPYCVTIDFQTLEDNTVTVRSRDTTKQKRVSINKLTRSLND